MEHRDEVVRCRLVAQLLIVDGQLTDDERTFLFKLMDQLGLDDDERRRLIDSVNIDDPVEQVLANLGSEARAAVLDDLRAAALADGATGTAERKIIERVVALMEP